MRYLPAVLCVLCLPSLAFAASFPKQSIFLSKEAVTEGDSVLIHATIVNDATSAFSGDIKFYDEDGLLGTFPVSLSSGETATESVSWKPKAGSHTVSADIIAKGSTDAVETEQATFTIAAKPAPAAEVSAVPSVSGLSGPNGPVGSSAPIETAIANTSPTAGGILKPVLSAIDSGRVSAAKSLDQGIAWAEHQNATTTTKAGAVLGAKTQAPSGVSVASITSLLWTAFVTLSLYALTILRYIVSNVALFYPVFIIVFFAIMWRLFGSMRRGPQY